MAEKILSKEQISQYNKGGLLFLRDVFGPEDVEQFCEAADDLHKVVSPIEPGKPRLQIEPKKDNGQYALRMIEPLVDLSPVFKELSEDRRIIDPVEQIFGEGAILFEDKINYKPPRVGSGFKMHQDSTYWKRFSRNILSAFVHLDDASEENGCLQVVPGFHRQGMVEYIDDGKDHTITDSEVRSVEPVKAIMNAGDVLIFHCLTPHASEPNRSDYGRRAIIFSYNPESDGDNYRYSEELLSTYHC